MAVFKRYWAGMSAMAGIFATFAAASSGGDSLSLPSDLRGLLLAEMQAVQAGMTRILPALVGGDWQAIATEADNIRNSYILEQRLTSAQRQELEHILPEGFKQRDEAFHALAAKLASAARQHDGAVAAETYGRLAQACVDCHSRYASSRFPGLIAPAQTYKPPLPPG